LVVENRVCFAILQAAGSYNQRKNESYSRKKKETLTANNRRQHMDMDMVFFQYRFRLQISSTAAPSSSPTPATDGAVGGNEAWSETVRGDGPRRPLSGRSRSRRHSPQQDKMIARRWGRKRTEFSLYKLLHPCSK